MRFTQSLCRQHLDRMFKRHWLIQGQRVPREVGADKDLVSQGIPICKPQDILSEKREYEYVEIVGLKPRLPQRDESHPLYKERECLMYRDHNVLLEGLNQAKIITKTVEINSGLPKNLLEVPNEYPNQDELVQRCILSSHLFDAVQVKLPMLHDPKRPAWRFPRVYGIPDYRCNRLISSKLIQLCESISSSCKGRYLIDNGVVTVPIVKENDLIQFEVTADLLMMSLNPLRSVSVSTEDITLPDLGPIKHTITLEKEHFYEAKDTYPIVKNKTLSAHTAIFHFNPTQVKNIYETPVVETQMYGRTLMKSFAVAAAQARHKYGIDIVDLPEPIVLQSIHTDGQYFQFAVFQLNTLNIDGRNGIKNILWMDPRKQLFSSCTYKEGKPSLDGYNPEVFKTFLAFYSNGLNL